MSKFTSVEIEYLQSQRLGRLATVGKQGDPHVVPVGFRYNPEHDSIDIGGYNMAKSRKYRDAMSYGRAAFVVDDSDSSGQPRMIEIRGTVAALPQGGQAIREGLPPEILRITPTHVASFGMGNGQVQPAQGKVDFSSRKVE